MPDILAACLTASDTIELKDFGARLNNLGVSFAVCDAAGKVVFHCPPRTFESDPAHLAKAVRDCLRNFEKNKDKHGNRYLASVLVSSNGAKNHTGLVAVIDLGDRRDNLNSRQAVLLGQMLDLFAEKFVARRQSSEQMDMIGAELSQSYEELVLLYKISTNMEIVEPDANFLQMVCDSVTEIVNVEGIAILQEKMVNEQPRFVLVAGAGVIDIDSRMTALIYNRLREQIDAGKEALLDSEVDAPFKYNWPKHIRNIIVVPLCGKEKPGQNESSPADRLIGMLVAVNRLDKPDFDSTDVKLFTSVASQCAVFVENNRLFSDLKDLFIGSLKALTRSIDAKDRYTRGHSERVAFISKWIAQRLAQTEHLDEEQIHKIYLAGLLHDIGKIGIDEKVLCKTGRLTKCERTRLRMHPSIGANILGGIKQMRDIIPGVLCHHERVDGKGYPGALKDGQIPLMGKIVGMADCFDAMTSDRSYHDALSVDEAITEIEERLGTQFDRKIGEVFINSDIYHLWDLMQDGAMKTYGAEDFSHYGAVAVGTLIR